MKHPLLGALLMLALPGLACDQCGCGLLLGVQPYDHANNFGLQWRMRYLEGSFDLHNPVPLLKHGGHAASVPVDRPVTYTEYYTVLEARGQFWLNRRASVTASMPLVNNFQSVDGIRHADVYGVGDPILLARYAVLASTSGPDTSRFRYRLTLGAGLKFPLGRTDVEQYGEHLDHDLQPGTGTWDPMVSVEYMMRGKKWGGIASMLGRYNSEMNDGFRFGANASFTAEIFRTLAVKQVSIVPSVGGYLECSKPDETNGVRDATTGGNVLFSNVGVRAWRKGLGVLLAWQHALVNDLGSLMIPNRERIVVGASYSFDKN